MLRASFMRIQKFLGKLVRTPGWDFSDAPDPRKENQVTHQMSSLLWSLTLGLISNQRTLRDVESMTDDLCKWARALIPDKISDTTLDTEIRRIEEKYLQEKLVQQTRAMHRQKRLRPEGLPIGVATVDGKNLATLSHNADGTGHERSSENNKWWEKGKDRKTQKSDEPFYLMPVLRATLTSAMAKPCIYQMRIPIGTGEATSVKPLLDSLHNAYHRSGMFEVIDGDAGLTSLANADSINQMGYAYVLGLKGNQPELYTEAQRQLIPKAIEQEPEVETPWERRSGAKIRRRLWRTAEMRGFINSVGCWSHLRQTWLVRQETKRDGKLECEDRFFVSSLTWNRLSGQQILNLVRGHWGVENDTFNSLDLQWHEDAGPWCTQGQSIWVLGLLRCMAYNIVQYLRKRGINRKRADGKRPPPVPWRTVFKLVTQVIEVPADELVATVTA